MRLPSPRALALAGACAGLAFALFTAVVAGLPGAVASVDRTVSDRARSFALAHDGWRLAWSLVTHSADSPVQLCLVATAVAWLLRRHLYRAAAFAAVTTTTAVAVRVGVLVAVARPRPVGRLTATAGWAYPSGHTTSATVLAGVITVLVLLLSRDTRVRTVVPRVVVGWAMLVGISRVVLVAHWPTDVLGGWLLGTTITCLAAAVLRAAPPPAWSAARRCLVTAAVVTDSRAPRAAAGSATGP